MERMVENDYDKEYDLSSVINQPLQFWTRVDCQH